MNRKRILLINPGTANKYLHVRETWADRLFVQFFRAFYDRRFDIPIHARCTTIPPVTLLGLRALVQERCESAVVDEQVEKIDFDAEADIVGITATTRQIGRAIEISQRFRARGIPTVIGGVHASCLPDECQPHFDSVCVGEAEGYLEQLLDDFEHGRLGPRYINRRMIPMSEVPFLGYETAGGRHLPFHVINFSRGCLFGCEFCSIQSSVGPFRTRAVADVVREIERVGVRDLFFPDATLTADLGKARELFRALVPLKVRWLGQVSLNVASNSALLDLMAESGCRLASVGFESLSQESVRRAGKVQNRVEHYARFIRALHDRRIAVEGNFVFGFDDDRPDAFDRTAAFVNELGIDLPEFYVLTPYPDTPLYRRLQSEGRIVDVDWSHYDNAHFDHLPVFQPAHMTREQLRDGVTAAERAVYGRRSTLRRLVRAGVPRVPVLIANYVFASRMARHGSLRPTETSEASTS